MPEPTRITIHLSTPDSRRLIHARARDAVPASHRVRAALDLWSTDPGVRQLVDTLAATNRAARRSSKSAAVRDTKITVVLDPALLKQLRLARAEDDIPMTERVRAALQLWTSNAEVGRRVNELAAAMHAQRQRSKKDVA